MYEYTKYMDTSMFSVGGASFLGLILIFYNNYIVIV